MMPASSSKTSVLTGGKSAALISVDSAPDSVTLLEGAVCEKDQG